VRGRGEPEVTVSGLRVEETLPRKRFEVVVCHLLNAPHGGVRPCHRKSTCLTQSNSQPYVVQLWSRTARNPASTKLRAPTCGQSRSSPTAPRDRRARLKMEEGCGCPGIECSSTGTHRVGFKRDLGDHDVNQELKPYLTKSGLALQSFQLPFCTPVCYACVL